MASSRSVNICVRCFLQLRNAQNRATLGATLVSCPDSDSEVKELGYKRQMPSLTTDTADQPNPTSDFFQLAMGCFQLAIWREANPTRDLGLSTVRVHLGRASSSTAHAFERTC